MPFLFYPKDESLVWVHVVPLGQIFQLGLGVKNQQSVPEGLMTFVQEFIPGDKMKTKPVPAGTIVS